MKLAKILVLAICLSLMTSGCFTKKSEKKATTTGTNGTSDTPSDDELGPGPNATFVMFVNGTALNATNGTITVSVGVNITFDASNSTGAEAEAGWDFGDGNTTGKVPAPPANTTEPTNTTTPTTTPTTTTTTTGTGTGAAFFLPLLQQATDTSGSGNNTTAPVGAVVTHNYTAPGNVTVTLYITDKDDRVANATVNLTVIASTPPTPLPDWTETFPVTAQPADTATAYYLLSACRGSPTEVPFTIAAHTNGTIAKKVETSTFSHTGTGVGRQVNLNLKNETATLFATPQANSLSYTTAPVVPGDYKLTVQVCSTTFNYQMAYGSGTITVTYGVPAAA